MENVSLGMCEGCGEQFVRGDWHIHHGWMHCGRCGVLYCVVDYDDSDEHNGFERKHTDEFTEAISEFYEEYDELFYESDKFNGFLTENYPKLTK